MTTSSVPQGRSDRGPLSRAREGADRLTANTLPVATYATYSEAQRAVDFLSDNQFPVNRTAIVGTGLRLIEQVLGRLTVAKAALAGAASGAWFGLLIGLLLGIFTVSAWWAVMLFGVLFGAAWGAIFGAIAHALTRGQRDFTSASTLTADEYTILIEPEYFEQARRLLSTLPNGGDRT